MSHVSFDFVRRLVKARGVARGGKYVSRRWNPKKNKGKGGYDYSYRHEGKHHAAKREKVEQKLVVPKSKAAPKDLLTRLLEAGGKLWEQYGKKRVYFNQKHTGVPRFVKVWYDLDHNEWRSRGAEREGLKPEDIARDMREWLAKKSEPGAPAAAPKLGLVDRIRAEVKARLSRKWAEQDAARAAGRVQEFGTDAPPGGWTEADKVPTETQTRLRAEARERRLRIDTTQELNKHLRFEKDQLLTIDGKQYRVTRSDDELAAKYPNVAQHVRVIGLKPLDKRAKLNRELLIRPSGQAEIHTPEGSAQATVVSGEIEGAKHMDDPHPFHAAAATAIDERAAAKAREQAEIAAKIHEDKERKKREAAERKAKIAEAEARIKRVQELEAKVKAAEAATGGATPSLKTPRSEAIQETARQHVDGEYINDRTSKVEQRGEDVLGSARHRAMEWKSLREALNSGDAEQMFTKKFLFKQEPIDFVSKVQSGGNLVLQLYFHLALQKFPGKPDIHSPGQPHGYSEDGVLLQFGRSDPGTVEVSAEEHVRRQRQSYYEAFSAFRAIIEKHADASMSKSPEDFRQVHNALVSDLTGAINEASKQRGYQDAGRAALLKATEGIFGRGKSAPHRKVTDFGKRITALHPGSHEERMDAAREAIMQVLEGKSMNAALGDAKKKRGYAVNLRDVYDTDTMRRKGPPSEYKSIAQGLDTLEKGGKYGMRAVQWGKSVTDQEREHHLKSLVDSMADLTDVLGLPASMASYNGKLAMAVGARGRAGALAHYEPGDRVINLTRMNGAGSLAHEWGHFFDHLVGKVDNEKAGSLSSPTQVDAPSATRGTAQALMASEAFSAFRERLGTVLAARRDMAPSEKGYWSSRTEMFARAFERHVQRKLHQGGRENTYLVAVRKAYAGEDGLWPTDAEVDAMAPHFERLFSAFAKSDLLQKMLRELGGEMLHKAGPYIGPRGGKWADAKHTIPWKEGSAKPRKAADVARRQREGGPQKWQDVDTAPKSVPANAQQLAATVDAWKRSTGYVQAEISHKIAAAVAKHPELKEHLPSTVGRRVQQQVKFIADTKTSGKRARATIAEMKRKKAASRAYVIATATEAKTVAKDKDPSDQWKKLGTREQKDGTWIIYPAAGKAKKKKAVALAQAAGWRVSGSDSTGYQFHPPGGPKETLGQRAVRLGLHSSSTNKAQLVDAAETLTHLRKAMGTR